MSSAWSRRAALRTQEDKLRLDLRAKLEAGELDAAKTLSDQIAAVEAAFSLTSSERTRHAAVAVLLICLVGVLATVRLGGLPSVFDNTYRQLRRTTFLLQVESDALSLGITHDWRMAVGSPIASATLVIEHVTGIGYQGGRLSLDSPGSTVSIKGSELTLLDLAISPGGSMSIARFEKDPNGNLTLYITGGVATLTIRWKGRGELRSAGPVASGPLSYALPDTGGDLLIQADLAGTAPLRIPLRGLLPPGLDPIQIEEVLSYRRLGAVPGQPGLRVEEETIRSGRLTVPSVGASTELLLGDRVELEDLRAQLLELRFDGALHSTIRGTASRIEVVSGRMRKRHDPTLAEFLYHRQSALWLVAVLVGVWGFLWQLRETTRV